MARIFITGSADGLGQLAASQLVKEGHEVVLHARNKERGEEAMGKVPGAVKVLVGDLSNMEETKQLAQDVNATGQFDAVIHNAGVYRGPAQQKLAVNTLAPYLLTCLVTKPKRLVYLSSGLHTQGSEDPEKIRAGTVSYSDTKLHDVILCMAVSRRWPDVLANAVNPGWVPTKMGGSGAPDSLEKGYQTQAWLAVSNDKEAIVSGRYFFHQQQQPFLPVASDERVQEEFLKACDEITGIAVPL